MGDAAVSRRKPNLADLQRMLAEIAGQPEQAANDSEPAIDREAIRERARRHAERMRRARNQG
jgi:hypothetical protein